MVVGEIVYGGTGVFESLQKVRYFCVCVVAMPPDVMPKICEEMDLLKFWTCC